MRTIRSWLKPALMVIAGVCAAATVSVPVPATAHHRAPQAAEAHSAIHADAATAHHRAAVRLDLG